MKQLTFFPLDSENHLTIEFPNSKSFISYLKEFFDITEGDSVVYLFTYEMTLKEAEGHEEIFIMHNTQMLMDIILNKELKICDFSKYHLHQYRSFEDAYAVALNMRETNELCYG